MRIAALSFLMLIIWPLSSMAGADPADERALWEFGAGMGFAHYEHYPASNQFSDLFLPFPTFQYRGTILRADDREGAHAYMLKTKQFKIELAGTGYPTLDSSNNEARSGMDNLPWLIALGPKLIYTPIENLDFAVGAYQATTTDFQMTKFNGGIFEGKITFRWENDLSATDLWQAGKTHSNLFLTIKGGTRQFNSLYFEVPSYQATSIRPTYEAREGLLSNDLSYFQSFKSGRASFYLGMSIASYSNSANRKSPLHRSDLNTTYVIGLTYVLGESRKPGVAEEETSGVVNKIRQKRQEKLNEQRN